MLIDFIIGLPLIIYNKYKVNSIFIIINKYIKYYLFLFIFNRIIIKKLIELFKSKVKLIYNILKSIILN